MTLPARSTSTAAPVDLQWRHRSAMFVNHPADDMSKPWAVTLTGFRRHRRLNLALRRQRITMALAIIQIVKIVVTILMVLIIEQIADFIAIIHGTIFTGRNLQKSTKVRTSLLTNRHHQGVT